MAVFVGDIHSSVLGLYGADEILRESGVFEGQKADLHSKSKSMLELAYEMDDCPTDSRVNRDKLIQRDIKDKKKASEKQKILTHYVKRLDRYRETHSYTDYERKLARLKQQVMMQNRGSDGAKGERKLTFDGEDLASYLLRNISTDLDEVTDQDNVLEYLQELEDFESESNKSEIQQCKKMLLRLEGALEAGELDSKATSKYMAKIAELNAKILAMEEQIYFSSSFKQTLASAQKALRKSHGKEIEDGYNIIPKASELLKGKINIGGRQLSAVDVAAIYRDKILCCENSYEAFVALVEMCMLTPSQLAMQEDSY
jgi:hypothetical protein